MLVGLLVGGFALLGVLCGANAQDALVIPQVAVSESQQGGAGLQLSEGQSAKLVSGDIPQVTGYGGNAISIRGLEESFATLIVPVEPKTVSDVPNSPVGGQGLIIGTGDTVLYEAQGTGDGFGFIQYGYSNSLIGRTYGHGNTALLGPFENNNRVLLNQFGTGNSLSIMQGQ
ncbi:hypothetical protein GCM10007094_19340 [Pseudovibrio japonicus]|uniref:Uncharacterized protein n=1 Tax=Pseudovibrio japonicus TaxID=366534 RepID=A0ABQ3ED49_9HYPH|nr:hypothetical protein [Pseudovibrio japonicus]GHB31029.1 hypothetical protein GCM10007094_19340 [Pseudovibrio japonicus]